MNLWSQYLTPQTVAEALQALALAPAPARPVAGGTDLLLEMQQGAHPTIQTLVDISRIPELQALELRGSSLFIGAAVPVSLIASSPLVRRYALAASEACGLIGGPQVRNTATLGGNVAHALPAADGAIALVALGAEVEIASQEGRRRVPILDFFQGVGKSIICDSADLLVGFHLPATQAGQASAFGRIMRPQGVALPVINLACWLERREGYLAAIRIAVGPAGVTPQRARAIEQALTGQPYGPQALARARELVDTTLKFRTSPARATAPYRYHLCKVLLEEVTATAWERSLQVEEK